jgi:L-cysteine desulfidase
VEAAKILIAENKVELSVAEVPNALYSEATVFNGENSVKVCIADEHINIIRIEKNVKTVFESNHIKTSEPECYSLAGVKPWTFINLPCESLSRKLLLLKKQR